MANEDVFKKTSINVDELSQKIHELSKSSENWINKLNIVEKSANEVGSTFRQLTNLVTGYSIAQNNMVNNFVQYGKIVDDLSKSTTAYGMSASKLNDIFINVTKTTNLSRQDISRLVQTIDNGLVGPRNYQGLDNLITKVSSLGKTAEQTQEIIESLVNINSKFGTGLSSGISQLTTKEIGQLSRKDITNALTVQFGNEQTRQNQFSNVGARQQQIMSDAENRILKVSETFTNTLIPIAEGFANTLGKLNNAGLLTLSSLFALSTFVTGSKGVKEGGGLLKNLFSKKQPTPNDYNENTTTPTNYLREFANKTAPVPVIVENMPAFSNAINSAMGNTGGTASGIPQVPKQQKMPLSSRIARIGGAITVLGIAGDLATGGQISGSIRPSIERAGTYIMGDKNKEAIHTGVGILGQTASGALSGAAMGSFFGPWGTAIGGLSGGALGLWNGISGNESKKEAKKTASDKIIKDVRQDERVNLINKEIEKSLKGQSINYEKIKSLVRDYNGSLDDGEQHLSAQQMILQQTADQMQLVQIQAERIKDVYAEQSSVMQEFQSFFTNEAIDPSQAIAASRSMATANIQQMEAEKSSNSARLEMYKEMQRIGVGSYEDIEKRMSEYKTKLDDINKQINSNTIADKTGLDKQRESLQGQLAEIENTKKSMDVMKDTFHMDPKTLQTGEANTLLAKNAQLNLKILKEQNVAEMGNIAALQERQTLTTSLAEGQERISQIARLGMGAEYGSIVNTTTQLQKELNISVQAMQQLQNLAVKTNQQMQKGIVDRKSGEAELNRLGVEYNRQQIKSQEAQLKVLDKMATLREKYVNALPEMSMGIGFELDPTQAMGLTSLMGPNSGSFLVGGNRGGGLGYTSGGSNWGGSAFSGQSPWGAYRSLPFGTPGPIVGSPSGVSAFGGFGGRGMKEGGYTPGNSNQPLFVKTHGREYVLNENNTNKLTEIARMDGGKSQDVISEFVNNKHKKLKGFADGGGFDFSQIGNNMIDSNISLDIEPMSYSYKRENSMASAQEIWDFWAKGFGIQTNKTNLRNKMERININNFHWDAKKDNYNRLYASAKEFGFSNTDIETLRNGKNEDRIKLIKLYNESFNKQKRVKENLLAQREEENYRKMLFTPITYEDSHWSKQPRNEINQILSKIAKETQAFESLDKISDKGIKKVSQDASLQYYRSYGNNKYNGYINRENTGSSIASAYMSKYEAESKLSNREYRKLRNYQKQQELENIRNEQRSDKDRYLTNYSANRNSIIRYAKGGKSSGQPITDDGGFLAVLHPNELILNEKQTKNLKLTSTDLAKAGVPGFKDGGIISNKFANNISSTNNSHNHGSTVQSKILCHKCSQDLMGEISLQTIGSSLGLVDNGPSAISSSHLL